MTHLIGAEIRRAWLRRLFRIALLGAVAGVMAMAILNLVTSDPNIEGALSAARADVARCERFAAEARARSIEDGVNPPVTNEEFGCGEPSDFVDHYDQTFRYTDAVPTMIEAGAIFGAVVAFLIGASFVGAEWGSGNIATFLTWEPRRGRVLLAKLAAIAIVSAVAVAVLLFLIAVIHFPVASWRGSTRGANGAFWGSVAESCGRAAGLAGMFAAAGGSIAMVARSTAGAFAVGGVYAGVIDPLLAFWRDGRLRPWLLFRNVPQFLGYAVEQQDPSNFIVGPDERTFELVVLSAWRPTFLLLAYVAALIALGYAAFRARDVT
jgi:hypothetical protein